MKQLIFFVLLLAASAISAQHTIYGTFSPAEDYQWLIAYQLKPGTQNYVAETRIQDGKFSLKLPENSSSGIYRLVYAVPQEEFYFDVLVNDEENIELSFTTRAGVSFSSSKENRLFNSYFEEINKVKQKIIGFYTSQNTDRNKFKGLVKQLKMIQNSYEEKTKGMMAENFVKANRPYLPADFEPVQDYINNKKQNYFNHLDFSNSVLQASDFLTDKIINYVFTALPLAHASPTELEKSVNKNVDAVVTRLPDVSNAYKVKLYYDLWKQATASRRRHCFRYRG